MPTQKRIISYLVDRDDYLIPVINSCSYPRARKSADIYLALLSSIASQQLSVKAADTIFNRFLDIFPERYPQPAKLLHTPTTRLRSAGLSQRKAEYMKNVARFSRRGDGLNYQLLKKYSDQELIEYLTQIKGVGQWTVEMLLMFSFNRQDVFPVDDLGIQQTIKRLYQLKHEGKELKQEMQVIAENWKPYRTIVCKFLWQWKSLQ